MLRITRQIKSTLKNTTVWIKLSNSNCYQWLRYPEQHKRHLKEHNFYKELFNSSKINLIFDVGANIGTKSSIFSHLATQVVAFEPSLKLFTFLKKRFRYSNVFVINCALGNDVSELDFYEIIDNEAYNSLSRKHIESTVTQRQVATIETVRKTIVKVDTLENFIRKYGTPEYIKIDVEGYEFQVIQGLKKAVQLVSFEANLPEFQQESIQIIQYLRGVSDNSYCFNFTTDNVFLLDSFTTSEDAIKFLCSTRLRYLEVYAKLY